MRQITMNHMINDRLIKEACLTRKQKAIWNMQTFTHRLSQLHLKVILMCNILSTIFASTKLHLVFRERSAVTQNKLQC